MFVSSREMLLEAQRGGYAVGAFNFENMEMLQAIVGAAEEMRAPIMLQTTPSTVKFASVELFAAMAREVAGRASVPVALHLDHGNSFELARAAAGAGYTSLMIDGSQLDFEANVALSRSVVDMVAEQGLNIPVEAELGTVGGKEDSTVAHGVAYTEPDKAAEFAERTGIASLAVAIGTAHGIYKGTPHLDIPRLAEIRKVVTIPLVLHGASGVPDDQVRACVANGICKVNYATELRIAYSNGVKAYLAEKPDTFDPKKYGTRGKEYVAAAVKARIEVLGSAGRA